MILEGVVQQVNPNSLLVREISTNNEILVNAANTRRFSRGDCVRVVHSGQMTFSIPPQIIAGSIQQIRCNQFDHRPPGAPSEMTALILQRRQGELLVRDIRNARQIIVVTPHSNHFCRGQRIIVTYDTIRMTNPPRVDARNIRTIC